MALKAAFYITSVFKNKEFSNPSLICEYLWRGWAIFEAQVSYIKHVVKGNIASLCPSYAFRETTNIMVHCATNFLLKFHLHGISDGHTWDMVGNALRRGNCDHVENLHSLGRLLFGGDMNFNLAEWCGIITKLQQIEEVKPSLKAAGMQFGATRDSERSYKGVIDLGCMEKDPTQMRVGHHSYMPPEKYEDFHNDMVAARTRGIALGLGDIKDAIPEMASQLQQAGRWNVWEIPTRPHGMVIGTDKKVQVPKCLLDATVFEGEYM